jgi:hypothetical protein
LPGRKSRCGAAQQAAGTVGYELEVIARMIEADGAAWPEEVARLRALAERVRERARHFSRLNRPAFTSKAGTAAP